MRTGIIVVASAAALAAVLGCGPSNQAPPKTVATDEATTSPEESPSAKAGDTRSETSGWHEVQSLGSSNSEDTGTIQRKSHVVVSSDPAKHGASLNFRFLVNSVPISGVFVAPGGQTTTFTIPVGTVHFTVDECEWEAQGFELAPGEDMPISCKLTKEGDCCEVAIPVEDDKPAKSGKPR